MPSTASETVNIKLEVDCVDANSETNNCFTGELHIKQELDQDLDTLNSEITIHKTSPSVTSFDHDYFQFENKQSKKENGKSIENSSWSNNVCQNESLEYDPFVKHENNCLGQTSLESSKSEMLNVSKNLCFHNENNIKNESVESGRSFSCHSVHDFRNNVFNGFRTEGIIKKELDNVNSSDICTELSRDALKDPLLPSTKVALPLKKPTTLVKCMDASGNIFFIALGRLNAPSLKPINYLETKCESVTEPSFPRTTTPTTVSSSETIRPSLVFGEHSDCLENTDLVQTQLSLGLDSLMLLVKKTQSPSMKTALNDLSSRAATTTTTLLSSSSCESLPGRESVTSSSWSEASSVGEPATVHSKQKTVLFLKDRQYYIVKPATLAVNSSVNKPQASNTVDCARNINPVLNTATIKIEPDLNIPCGVKTFGKSILNMPYGSINSAAKPSYSLLKKQTNIPLRTPSLLSVVKSEPAEEGESGFLLKRRPDVSNKKMLGINQTHSAMLVSKCFEYEEKVSQAVSRCKFPNQAMCVRWLLRHLPLVSTQASDTDYKSVHPFCASSATNFIQWNVGKQRSSGVAPSEGCVEAVTTSGVHRRDGMVYSCHHGLVQTPRLHTYGS
uniref:YEATS domain-containing protein n=1 Tax=Timema poppense TaxID=170557 RepID=A0A7R9HCX5_TIMPO|nr:unnamed protein product [Timema poppensis]